MLCHSVDILEEVSSPVRINFAADSARSHLLRANTVCLLRCDDPLQVVTMSNSHPLRPHSSAAQIDHMHLLSEQLGALLPGEEYSDVTLVVEEKRFPAHRVILAARCHYFRYLGNTAHQSKPIWQYMLTTPGCMFSDCHMLSPIPL